MLRSRDGTSTPRYGADTTLPPIEIVPAVGCSSPATQRRVVVLPQPDGPSSTTISPAATRKLTSSTAGRPTANCLRRCETINSADIQFPCYSTLSPTPLIPAQAGIQFFLSRGSGCPLSRGQAHGATACTRKPCSTLRSTSRTAPRTPPT